MKHGPDLRILPRVSAAADASKQPLVRVYLSLLETRSEPKIAIRRDVANNCSVAGVVAPDPYLLPFFPPVGLR